MARSAFIKDGTLGAPPEDIYDPQREPQDGRFPVEAPVEVLECLDTQLAAARRGRSQLRRAGVHRDADGARETIRVGFDLPKPESSIRRPGR